MSKFSQKAVAAFQNACVEENINKVVYGNTDDNFSILTIDEFIAITYNEGYIIDTNNLYKNEAVEKPRYIICHDNKWQPVWRFKYIENCEHYYVSYPNCSGYVTHASIVNKNDHTITTIPISGFPEHWWTMTHNIAIVYKSITGDIKTHALDKAKLLRYISNNLPSKDETHEYIKCEIDEIIKKDSKQKVLLDCEINKPTVTFNGTKKWFTMVFVEIHLRKVCSNKNYINDNRQMLHKRALEAIQSSKKWQSYGVPINIIKCTSLQILMEVPVDLYLN